MAVDFLQSRTKDNLMRAFAGESQARNRYTFAAEQAHKAKMQLLAELFRFTSAQELAHAKVFYDHLKQFSGQTLRIDGRYPVNVSDNVLDLLKFAHHNEMQEFEEDYPTFAQVAREEGFAPIAASFQMIAAIEGVHAKRFLQIAQLLEQGQLFASGGETVWMCMNCGHLHHGTSVPQQCPVCQHDQGFFVPGAMAAWNC